MTLLDDAQLAEIEAHLDRGCGGHEDGDILTYCSCFEDEAADLLAEVRRLRAVREAAGLLIADGPPTTDVPHCAYCSAWFEDDEPHAADCLWERLRGALEA